MKESRHILDPASYKKHIDKILTLESSYGKELELWTGVTSHEVIDNVDNLKVNMEAQLKSKLLKVQMEELEEVFAFLKHKIEESYDLHDQALISSLLEYNREYSTLIQKLCINLENEATDFTEA